LALAFALPLFPTAAPAQSFESLVEDALKRQQEGAEPPPAGAEVPPQGESAPQPFGSEPPPSAPAPGGQQLNPVELGPRPYTPPTVEPQPGEEPTAQSAGAPSSGAASPPASSGAPSGTSSGSAPADQPAQAGTTPPAVPPGTERTRESLQVAEVNAATLTSDALAVGGANPLVLKTQVLLDRAGASPGVIDAYAGGNLSKAIAAVETVLKLEIDGQLDARVWEALRGNAADDVLVQYTITGQDLSYPFAAAIPEDYSEQARMPSLAYTSPEEMFAERFHMDERLLRALNPEADFRSAGTTIWVANVEAQPVTGNVASIVADKARGQVRAYDAGDRLLVAYPATIGSAENPSPTGRHAVDSIAPNPAYYYDPANFVQGDNTEKLTLPSGPNNPVGSTWIDLTDPGYGIHGTPEPSKIGKTASHGCVRLTNWDAEELAGMLEPGVVVTFLE
jgi:lipoprotein-anchoring transpeptidase ErfK/SrfK